jgi:uncharacterized protein YigA (DUF484 family)
MNQIPDDLAGRKRSGTQDNVDDRDATERHGSGRITGRHVIDYLDRHPEFLMRHPDLLERQNLPNRINGDRVADLQTYLLDRLRGDISKLRTEQDELLSNSRDNLSTQDRVHRAVLALLGASTFEQLIEIVTTDLSVLLDVDVVTLCIESDVPAKNPVRYDGLLLLRPGTIDEIMGAGNDVLLRDDICGEPAIFGGAAGLVRSDALIRLMPHEGSPDGLIAFGTRHPGFFNPGQGTELLNFLARIIEHCIRAWLTRSL